MDKIDPFTQRMLERARLRKEKLDSKLPPSEKPVLRKPLSENNRSEVSPTVLSPSKKFFGDYDTAKSTVLERKLTINSPKKTTTVHEGYEDSSVAVEINIVHQNNVQVDVQVEEREVTLSQYLTEKEERVKMTESTSNKGSSNSGSVASFYSLSGSGNDGSGESQSSLRADLTDEGKNKLKRLGKLYSEDGALSSPVNSRTELHFGSESSLPTPSRVGLRSGTEAIREASRSDTEEPRRNVKNRHATSRFAALANHINNFEDDMRHFDFHSKEKKISSSAHSTDATSSTASIQSLSPKNTPLVKRAESKKRESLRPRTSIGGGSPKSTAVRSSPRQASPNVLRNPTTQASPKVSTLLDSASPKVSALSNSPKASPNVASVLDSSRRCSPRQASPKVPVVNSSTYDKKKDVNELKKTFQAQVIGSSPKKHPAVSIVQTSKWDKSILADLESKGFKRVSLSQSRLVYDFSPSNHLQGDKPTPASNMAAVAAVTSPSRSPRNNITKKPSIKKHKAPAPPGRSFENGDEEKENGVSDNNCGSSVEDISADGKCENETVAKQESACSSPRSQRSVTSSTSSSNRSSPISRDRRMADNSNVNGSPGGNVMSKAAIFETTASPRNTDPALMSMRERKALFEKNKGAAIVPKAAFGMAPPIKALQNNSTNDKANLAPKKPVLTSLKPRIEPKPSDIAPTHLPSPRSLGGRMMGLLQPTLGEKEIVDKVRKQRDQEMLMLRNRFLRTKMEESEMDRIETEIDNDDDDPTSEDSPLMGAGDHRKGAAPVSADRRAPSSPKVVLAPRGDDDNEMDGVVGQQPNKRRSSTDSPQVVSVLEEVKRIRVSAPKEGRMYPSLSDIDNPTTEDEASKMSCIASSLNTSSDSAANEHVENDWGNTSFTRDVLKAVGVKKTNESALSKARKAVRRSREHAVSKKKDDSYESSSDGENNQDLDDLLDEVLDADDDTEGPTPPKLNKNLNPALPSTSFHYKKGTEPTSHLEGNRFKSPLKTPPKSVSNRGIYQEEMEGGKPLVHTVSFYRRQQSQGSQPSTPIRVVRHEEQQQVRQQTVEDAEEKRRADKAAAVDARQRVKELLEEAAKQNTVISQASQALNLCASTIEFSGSTEQAEGERLLLLATHRRQACLHEVQRIQVEGVPASPVQVVTLSMQELSLPLRRDYVRQLNADGALGHYLVCLIKCQERVIATSMMKTTPESFSVTFPDKVRLEGLSSDFKVTVDVYALQASKEILPHDVKYHIATKKSGKLATPRKGCRGADLRAPLMVSPGGPSAVRTPALQPHGYCIFGHSQVTRTSFSLNKVCHGGPLEGSLRVTLASDRLPTCTPQRVPLKGFLTMFEEAGGFGAWHRRWCVLRGQDLSYWRYPDHEGTKPPMGTIELSSAVSERVAPAPRDVCARPHTLLLQTSVCGPPAAAGPRRRSALCLREDGTNTHLLASDTRLERDQWMEAINTALEDIRAAED